MHWAHEEDAARVARGGEVGSSVVAALVDEEVKKEEDEESPEGEELLLLLLVVASLSDGRGAGGSWPGPSGIIVLFVKQVHLQKVGAPGLISGVSRRKYTRRGGLGRECTVRSFIPALTAAKKKSIAKSKRRCIRAILTQTNSVFRM